DRRDLDRCARRARAPELRALVRVRGGEVVGALREADTHRCDRDAAAVEDLHELAEAAPALAEKVPLGYGAGVEGELTRVGGVPAELVHGCRDLVAGGAVRDDQVRDLFLARARRERGAGADVGAR